MAAAVAECEPLSSVGSPGESAAAHLFFQVFVAGKHLGCISISGQRFRVPGPGGRGAVETRRLAIGQRAGNGSRRSRKAIGRAKGWAGFLGFAGSRP